MTLANTSLLDSQTADRYHEGFDDAARISRVVGKLSAEDAATAMRDLCVATIRGMSADTFGGIRKVDAIERIESLTLDHLKEKQS